MSSRRTIDLRAIQASTATATAAPHRNLEAEVTRHLAVIRGAWPRLHNPPHANATTRHPPASRPPMRTDALSLIAEISRDLAFWVQALIQDDTDGDPSGLRLDDAMGCARYLSGRAAFIATWAYGRRLTNELGEHAHAVRGIAWPRRPSILLGDCPRRVHRDGIPEECATPVRAHTDNPGDVRCRGCGHTDTLDGWMLAIVGDSRPVTIPQLVPLLHKRLGIVVSTRTLQRLHRSGQLCAPTGGTRETPTFDRRDVYAVMMARVT